MNTGSSTIRTSCRACESRRLSPVLSLGTLPLANGLLNADRVTVPERRYPLDIVFCADCALVQITATVPPDDLFRDYAYISSASDTASTKRRSARHPYHRAARPPFRRSGRRDREQRRLPFAALPRPRREECSASIRRGTSPPSRNSEESLRCPSSSRRPSRSSCARVGYIAGVLHANNVLAHVPDLPA